MAGCRCIGKADAQAYAGQIDAAIETLKSLAAKNDEHLPADAILMHLARAYVQKGNRDEARKTFTEIVDKHPGLAVHHRGARGAGEPQRMSGAPDQARPHSVPPH